MHACWSLLMHLYYVVIFGLYLPAVPFYGIVAFDADEDDES